MSAPLRVRSRAARLPVVPPIVLLLAGKVLVAAFGVNVAEVPGGVMLAVIAGYGVLIWQMAMNDHRAQQDELY